MAKEVNLKVHVTYNNTLLAEDRSTLRTVSVTGNVPLAHGFAHFKRCFTVAGVA